MSFIDLHTHSYCSDGTFSPEGIVLLAKKEGLSAVALTDHDTIDGIALFMEAGAKHGVETVPGVEFAALWPKYSRPEIHIVGLGFAPSAPVLQERMEEIRESRSRRNEKMARKLTAAGLPVTLEEVAANAGGEIITRAHFANVLLEKGYIKTRKDALSETQLEELCRELASEGLDGMECMYSTYTPAQTKAMRRLAVRVGLLPSGGSDFHGENKPDIHLGRGLGKLRIPYEYWEAFKRCTLRAYER